DFSLGFRPLNNTNIFLLAIWFARIPERTIVWHANTTSPVRTNSTVKLTAEGLTLNNRKDQTIWKAQPKTPISYAVMLNTGNFVLVSSLKPTTQQKGLHFTSRMENFSSNHKSANIYIAKRNGEAVQLSWHNIVLNNPSNYYRATMDFDGQPSGFSHLNSDLVALLRSSKWSSFLSKKYKPMKKPKNSSAVSKDEDQFHEEA
ncbi:hypothetical protein HYC85_012038, partial [Camellia sinensis]